MGKRKRSGRRRVRSVGLVVWSENHAGQSRVRNVITERGRLEGRVVEARGELRRVVGQCYLLGATPEWLAGEMGVSAQSVRRSWLPPYGGEGRRGRVPTAHRLAWSRNHAARSRVRNTIGRWRRLEGRVVEARGELRRVVGECYVLGATPEWLAGEMGVSAQAVRKSWLRAGLR